MTAPHEPFNLRQHDPDNTIFPTSIEPPATSRLTPSSVPNLHRAHLEAGSELQQSSPANLQSSDNFFATDPTAGNYFLYGSKSPHGQFGPSSHLIQQGRHSISGTEQVDFSPRNVKTLANFGSQPWLATPNPFLGFAPRPMYELTGELLEEEPGGATFSSFNNPFTYSGHVTTSPTQNARTSPVQHNELAPSFGVTDTGLSTGPYAHSLLRSALKRKTASLDPSPSAGSTAKKQHQGLDLGKSTIRTVSFESMSAPASSSEDGPDSSEMSTTAKSMPSPDLRRPQGGVQPPVAQPPGPSVARMKSNRSLRESASQPPAILPKEKVFPIQIGSELFRLSGASLSSDAPSYFTHFFEDQLRQNEESGGVRTLYIDRDPVVFRDIARHLQGYHVKPMDGSHFVRLFADAQFYHLPRLVEQLFESEIFIQVGDRHFQIPKDIFSDAGNTPNFFSLGFALFFSNPGDAFSSLDRRGLLRPPSITPPYVAGRSADIFAELIQVLRGYPLQIQNETHRASLLRDCRYFHLRGLEQKLIAHEISYNSERDRSEISLRLEDIKPSGISFKVDEESSQSTGASGWVNYARPFVDDHAYELVLEITGETMSIDLTRMRGDFRGLTKSRIQSLLQVIANKMNLPSTAPLGLVMLAGGSTLRGNTSTYAPLSDDQIKIRFEEASHVTLDGEVFEIDTETPLGRRLVHGHTPTTEDTLTSPTVPSASEVRDRNQALSPPPAQRMLSSQARRQPARTGPRPPATGTTSQSSGAAPTSSALSPADPNPAASGSTTMRKRKRRSSADTMGRWIVRGGQWRLKIQPSQSDQGHAGPEMIFVAVKTDIYSCERTRNTNRGYLGISH